MSTENQEWAKYDFNLDDIENYKKIFGVNPLQALEVVDPVYEFTHKRKGVSYFKRIADGYVMEITFNEAIKFKKGQRLRIESRFNFSEQEPPKEIITSINFTVNDLGENPTISRIL